MKNKGFTIPLVAIAAGFLLIGIFIHVARNQPEEVPVEEALGAVLLTRDMTQATTSVSTTRVKLLSANSGRLYTRVEVGPTNNGVPLYVYLTSASTTVIAGGGIPLMATTTTTFVIDESNLYTGEIWAISAAAQPVYVTTN